MFWKYKLTKRQKATANTIKVKKQEKQERKAQPVLGLAAMGKHAENETAITGANQDFLPGLKSTGKWA